MNIRLRAQQGVALPVMLMMLVVMLVGGLYLFKSTNSAALTTTNLAYDETMGRAADFGLMNAFQWLSTTAKTNKGLLDADSIADGYVATLDTTQTVRSAGFWNGAVTVVDSANNNVQYVIHRLCSLQVAYDAAGNTCVQTSANPATLGSTVAAGSSLAADAPAYAGSPQLHYVITSRIFGPRGGNVVNQTVVLIGG